MHRIPLGQRKQSHILRRYWIAYVCLSLIPLVIMISTLVLVNRSNHRATAEQAYLRSVAQTASRMDHMIQNMQSASSGLGLSGELEDWETLPQLKEQVPMISAYLTAVEQNSMIPCRAMIYISGSKYLYTDIGVEEYRAIEDEYQGRTSFTMSGFFTRINRITSMTVWPMDGDRPTASGGLVAFAFPLFTDSNRKLGSFVILVEDKDILELISSYLGMEPDYTYVYTASLQDGIVVSERTAQDQEARSELIRSRVGLVTPIRVSGTDYDVIHYKSDIYGLHIITAVDLSRLYGGTSLFLQDSLLMFLVLSVFILIIALFLARYFYRPVQKLLARVGEVDSQEGEDDFERIGQKFTSMEEEVNLLQERIAMQRPMVRDQLISRLMRGTLRADEMETFSGVCADIPLDHFSAYVILVPVTGEKTAAVWKQLERLDVKGADIHGVLMEMEQVYALLAVCHEMDCDRLSQAGEVQQFLAQQGLNTPTLAVGRQYTGTERVSHSFLEAFIALHDHPANDRYPSVYLYDAGALDQPEGKESREEHLRIFLQGLQSSDQATALALLDQVLDELEAGADTILNRTYERYDFLMRTLRKCDQELAASCIGGGQLTDVVTEAGRFRQEMIRITQRNCSIMESNRSSKTRILYGQILEQIREHCMKSDFSLGMLSEMVGYSSTYINRCLRDETGYSFIQYVSLLRIGRAKQMLLDTDLKIKDIVQRVGYQDMASFSRKFKESEGVTPQQYREINQTERS